MDSLKEAIKKQASPSRALNSQRFFKTGKGQYGEGDIFLGLTVPQCRIIAKEFRDISLSEIEKHISSKFHEERLIALLILVGQYMKSHDKKKIVDFYLAHTTHINNWDLVDLSAHKIVGEFLQDKDKRLLYELAKSNYLWERRIAIISTFAFIKEGHFEDSLKIAKLLMKDTHDLIHKACGWMLREVGKKDIHVLERFLDEHHKQMPRTMLRYSLERLSEEKRRYYMQR